MADDKPGRGSDQFPLRLPDGMRDRIKAYADLKGRSMNAEIVRVLEKEFPAPAKLEDRVYELLTLVDVLKQAPSDENVDQLIDSVRQTMRDIASGRIKLEDQNARDRVREGLRDWERFSAENEAERQMSQYDDEELEALKRGDDPFKG